MSINFSSSPNAFEPLENGLAMNPGNVRFGSPSQLVIGAGAAKVIFGTGTLDKSRAEVLVACLGEGFGHFMAEVLSDHELGLTRVVMGDGRTLGGLIFVGKEKKLFLPFDAHSPTIRKVLSDWKKHKSIQCFIKTDIGDMGFTSPLRNGILDKLLAVKEDKFECRPSMEMMLVMKVVTDQFAQSAEVVTAPLLPCDESGVLTKQR